MKTQGSKTKHTHVGVLPPSVSPSFQSSFLKILGDLEAATPLDRDLAFKVSYLHDTWLSKYNTIDKNKSKQLKELAIEKWLVANERNKITNERLLFDSVTFSGGVSSLKIIKFARLVIRQILGDSLPAEKLYGKFSNGASTRVGRGPSAIAEKFVGEAHVTPEAWEIFKTQVLPTSPTWVRALMEGDFSPSFVPGSEMFTVPKNSEIDRVACKEPEINMYLQRGIGCYIRDRLLSRGIDLTDQSRNQRLALEGSIGRKLATLDLSSASDLISTQLVYELLPIDWFLLLDAVRVKSVAIDEERQELHMFSSMGNGFTFELESLLFYALACAINRAYGVRGRISVYGDDIITPTCIAASYAPIFSWFGFKINRSKSFWTGGFRESCGKHYRNGYDVTPFFLKAPIVVLSDLIHQLNKLREWATRDSYDYYSPELYLFWKKWSKSVPRTLYGGRNTDDKMCLVTTHRPRKRLKAVLRDRRDPNDIGAYLYWLHSAADRPEWDEHCGNRIVRAFPPEERRRRAILWANWEEHIAVHQPSLLSIETSKLSYCRNGSWSMSLETHLWFHELWETTEDRTAVRRNLSETPTLGR